MRLHTYNEPFERDITSHAVIAHEMLAGRPLYSDLWDSKPPAIFVTYAIGDIVAGYGPSSVYFLGVAAAVITLLGAYYAGTAYGGKPAGLWAAAFWAFICSDMRLWANQPNIEAFMNPCLVWAFALIARAEAQKLQFWRWLIIGSLFAIATLYKPVVIVFAAFLSVAYLSAHLRSGRQFLIALAQICITALVGAVAWAAVFGYFAITDRFQAFYNTIFTYGRYYAQSRGGNLMDNITEGFSQKRLFSPTMQNVIVMAVLAGAGIAYGLWTGVRKKWLLFLGFALAAPFAVALPGRFYAHYYQLWLCPLVVGTGWALATVGPSDKTVVKILRTMAGAIGLIILLISVLGQYKYSADQWSAMKINPQFVISREVVREVDEMLEPDETLYVWGINPEFYFWTKRRPPTGLIWATDLVEGPFAQKNSQRALLDLKKSPPEVIVFNILHVKRPPGNPVLSWIRQNYVALPVNPYRGQFYGRTFLFCIYIRQDGRLAKSLAG
jgi:hypothetical protein